MVTSEIFGPLLYGRNYLAADHQRDFRPFIIQTYYFAAGHRRDFRPLFYRENFFADDHREIFSPMIGEISGIQTELPRRCSSPRFPGLYYRITLPMIGEIY